MIRRFAQCPAGGLRVRMDNIRSNGDVDGNGYFPAVGLAENAAWPVLKFNCGNLSGIDEPSKAFTQSNAIFGCSINCLVHVSAGFPSHAKAALTDLVFYFF